MTKKGWDECMGHCIKGTNDSEFFIQGILVVNVLRAHKLPKKNIAIPNPCAILYVGNSKPSRTAAVNDSLNPEWHQHFELPVNYSLNDLTITIIDEDPVNHHQILGKVIIDLEPFKNNGKHAKNFVLSQVVDKVIEKKKGSNPLADSARPPSVDVEIEFSVKPYTLPSIKTKVFGVSLAQLLGREDHQGKSVPNFLVSAVDIIKQHGASLEGIFRISGSASELHSMKSEIDAGTPLTFDPSTDNIHNVSGLLKLYFRELPEPLLTYEHCDEFVTNAGKPQNLKSVVAKLPKENFTVLKFLVEFLHFIVGFDKQNKMTPSNLGIVIGPNVLRSKSDSDIVAVTAAGQAVIATLITSKDAIF